MIETIELPWRFGTIELPAPDRYIREAIEITGEYSGREFDLYQALLRPGDVALDVGANIGVFAVAMGLAVGPTGRVLAFEPQPLIFDILQRNLSRHGLRQVQAHRAIVAEAAGDGVFVDLHTLPADRKLNFGGLGRELRVRPEFGSMAATPVTSIDGLALDRCAFIKIDVEGAEEAVLQGASQTIARCRPILSLECDRPNAEHPWVDPVLAAGYRLWRFRGANLRAPNPKGASIEGHDNFTVIMALAIPDERLDVMDGIDCAGFQRIETREALEVLSRRIKRHET